MTVTLRHRVTGAEIIVDGDAQVEYWTERGYRPDDQSTPKAPAKKAAAKKAPAAAKK